MSVSHLKTVLSCVTLQDGGNIEFVMIMENVKNESFRKIFTKFTISQFAFILHRLFVQ